MEQGEEVEGRGEQGVEVGDWAVRCWSSKDGMLGGRQRNGLHPVLGRLTERTKACYTLNPVKPPLNH